MIENALIFVDGENLVLRYQEMLKAGRKAASGNVHIQDCFIWNQKILDDHLWNLKRVSYYTSVVGDDVLVRAVREQIAATTFTCCLGGEESSPTTRTGQIVPFVRKKSSKSKKESICDISIAVDVMRACYRDHASIIWLFSGDGDFLPLFSEIVHNGKVAYGSAVSSGCNDELRFVVDEFLPLDKYLFVPETTSIDQGDSADA
ncbi:MAG: NYN domain-containing protein [Pseudomonadota bacterium]